MAVTCIFTGSLSHFLKLRALKQYFYPLPKDMSSTFCSKAYESKAGMIFAFKKLLNTQQFNSWVLLKRNENICSNKNCTECS